jgi:hypothetical protein
MSDAFTKPFAPLISDTRQWAALEEHKKVIEATHLRVRASPARGWAPRVLRHSETRVCCSECTRAQLCADP